MKIETQITVVAPDEKQKAAALKAAKGFEAVFMKEMLKSAMPSGTREESVYGDCMADALSQESAKGGGLGLAEWMMKNGLGKQAGG